MSPLYDTKGLCDFDEYLDYLNKSGEILCSNYGEIGGLWFDRNWSKPDADWKEDKLYATIRQLYFFRGVIEGGIVRLAAQGAKSNELAAVSFASGLTS